MLKNKGHDAVFLLVRESGESAGFQRSGDIERND